MKEGDRLDFKRQYFALWTESWNFHKRHYPARRDDPKYWDDVVSDYGKICEKNRDKPEFGLLRDLLLAVISELERASDCYKHVEIEERAG